MLAYRIALTIALVIIAILAKVCYVIYERKKAIAFYRKQGIVVPTG